MSSETTALLAEINAFLGRTGMAESTFGRRAVNDGKLVTRLRAGGGITLRTAADIRRFIDASAIPSRPALSPAQEEAA